MNEEQETWYVYMVSCSDSTLYTGITTDLERRVREHNGNGRGAKYTKCRQPVSLVYFEKAASRSEAGRREYAIKQLNRREKLSLFVK